MIEGYAFVLREPRGGWRGREGSHRSLFDESRDREQPWREEKAGSLFKVTRLCGRQTSEWTERCQRAILRGSGR